MGSKPFMRYIYFLFIGVSNHLHSFNAHYFYIFRNYFVVVLSIPANLRLHSLVIIDQSSSVYASAIDSRKHFLFFREPVKHPGGLKTWLTFSLEFVQKKWGTLLYSVKLYVALIEAKCATGLVCSRPIWNPINGSTNKLWQRKRSW